MSNDIQAALELLESEADEQLEQELLANFYFLSNELKHVEILNLLNQPFDDKGALITITAGNSDLDSQDWVNIIVKSKLFALTQAQGVPLKGCQKTIFQKCR